MVEIKLTPFVRLTADNFQNAIMSAERYREITLCLSTGDFCTHTVRCISDPKQKDVDDALTALADLSGYDPDSSLGEDMDRLLEVRRLRCFIRKFDGIVG